MDTKQPALYEKASRGVKTAVFAKEFEFVTIAREPTRMEERKRQEST